MQNDDCQQTCDEQRLDTRSPIFFGRKPCICKGSGEKEVSLRTIAQDLTKLSNVSTNSGYWEVWTLVFGFNIPAGRNFTPAPQKKGGFLVGQFSAVPKFYGTYLPTTLNPELLQHWALKILQRVNMRYDLSRSHRLVSNKQISKFDRQKFSKDRSLWQKTKQLHSNPSVPSRLWFDMKHK